MRYSQPELVDRLAAAYVSGTLMGGARRRFERLRHERIDIQLAVAAWELRLGTLARSVPPAQPSPRVWAAIEARTQPRRQPRRPVPPAVGAIPAPDSGRPAMAPGWLAAVSGLVGAALGVVLASGVFVAAPALWWGSTPLQVGSSPETLPPSYVGLLTDAQGNGKLLASSLRHGHRLTIKAIGPIDAPAQGRLVLWALQTQGAPFVLGTAPARGSVEVALPGTSEDLLAHVTRLVVTVETDAAPGTPGRIVYTGSCIPLW